VGHIIKRDFRGGAFWVSTQIDDLRVNQALCPRSPQNTPAVEELRCDVQAPAKWAIWGHSRIEQMRTFLFLAIFLASPSLPAQTPTPATGQAEKPAAQDAKSATDKPDPKLHADAVKLVELSDARKRLENGFASMTEEAKKQMMQQCPQCSAEFGEEWSKRMLARLKADDFLEVFVQAYEKSFTDDEIVELIKLQEKRNDSQPPAPSPHLKEKVDSAMPTVMSEIMGGSTRIGAKLGAEIGAEIEKEHPEYIKAKPEKQ
jgi:hypothetical protein